MPVIQRGKLPAWPAAGRPAAPIVGTRRPGGPVSAAAEQQAALRWLERRDSGRSEIWLRRVARNLWLRCNRLNAPVVYPWCPSYRGTGAVHAFHRLNAAKNRGRHGRGLRRLWLWSKACVWPLAATAAAGPLVWRQGRRVRDRFQLSLPSQLRDLLGAAWRHGIFPAEYYHHRIFRTSPEIDRALYLNERELRLLLRECTAGLDTGRVNDAARFVAECRDAGLPVVRTPVVFARGRTTLLGEASPDRLPARDLFLRPMVWSPGVSGQQWRWNAQARAWVYRDEVRKAEALLELGCQLGARAPWVLHESVNNHPDISRFAAGGVCTVRIVTGLDESAQPQVLFAALHLPASAEAGWGPAPGALTAGIEVATGRLDAALDEFEPDGEFSVHPGTGVMIQDEVVPQWPALCELALRAHARFAEFPFVGWRIALAGGGPVLLEAATEWDGFRHVWPARTAFAEWCRRRLNGGAEEHPAFSGPVRSAGGTRRVGVRAGGEGAWRATE